nr:hypothetical protein [Tanacetum cinerariifolium]
MSIQEMEDLKQHYLDEMLSLSNDLGIKDYRNGKIDIRFRRECEDMIDELKEPEDSLIMGNEELNTILENESNEFIKSNVEDLVPILRESKDTSGSDSECILSSCDDFSPINVVEEKPMTFSNPLSDYNKDECFTLGNDIKILLHHDPSIPKMSFVSILEGFTDEPHLEENDDLFDLESKEIEWKKILYDIPINDLMTEDKIFDLGGDIDEIDAFS